MKMAVIDCGKDARGRRLIRNPDTGRCVLRDGPKGMEILEVERLLALRGAVVGSSRNSPSPRSGNYSPSPRSGNYSPRSGNYSPSPRSGNYSPRPRTRGARNGGGVGWSYFAFPAKILATALAAAVAIKAAQWGGRIVRDEADRWVDKLADLVATFIPKLLGKAASSAGGAALGAIGGVGKVFTMFAQPVPPIDDSELKRHFDECCATQLQPRMSRMFLGLVRRTVRDVEDACRMPTTMHTIQRWEDILQDVKDKVVSPEILRVMRYTYRRTKYENLPVGYAGTTGGVKAAFRRLGYKIKELLPMAS